MTACPLNTDRLEHLLAGRLTDDEARAVAEHLAGDCSECEKALDQAGVDEETLLACLAALREPAPAPQMAPSSPLGVTSITLVCASVLAS